MRVQSDTTVAQTPFRPAESSGSKDALIHAACAGCSGSKDALIHAACAGCLGVAAWIGARAIGIDPGLLTLGIGVGLGEGDTEVKANMVALHGFLFLGLAMISGDWKWGVTAIGSLIAGVVGGEGIAAIGGIDRIARRSIGVGIATGAEAAMIAQWVAGVGAMQKIDPIFVGLMGSVIAWDGSREADQVRSSEKTFKS